MENLKYPVGKLQFPDNIDANVIEESTQIISSLPILLDEKTKGLTSLELKYRYRPEGWNIRQLVHHLADSHINSFIRFKLALTEENPVIKPYYENKWSELPDVTEEPVGISIKILEGVHQRWVTLLNSMSPSDFSRTFVHPEHKVTFSLRQNVFLYAWHCRHHLAHVDLALEHKY